jgi:hypothetical protein
MADVLFTTFQFAAQGAPTPRSMPVRLAEQKNVKDFGAIGDGSVNDGPAIQAAVDWTSGPDRGTIFFPAGFYTINAPITFNYDPAPGDPGLSIYFKGEGASTFLNGRGFPGNTGYTLDRHLATPNNTANVFIENMSVGFAVGQGEGSIRVGSCNSVTIRNVGGGGITTEDSPGNSSQSLFIAACNIGSPGLITGAHGTIQNCNWTSCDVAARLYGSGWALYGCRAEECNTTYLIGLDSGVAATFTGTIAHSGTNDGSGVLTIPGAVTGTIKPLQSVSDGGVNIPGAIFIVSQLTGTPGGTGTYALSNPTVTVSSPQTITTIGNDVGASGFAIHGGSQEGAVNGIVYAGTCSGFYHGSMGNLGHSGSGPGQNFPSQYYLIVGPNVSDGVFQSMYGRGDLTEVAACKIYSAAARANVLFLSCDFYKGGTGSGFDWDTPSNAYTAQWLNCNIAPTWTYSQLGTTNGVNVLEGDQVTITDGAKSGGGTAGWGDAVQGGASQRLLVRWNGSAWTVVGK